MGLPALRLRSSVQDSIAGFFVIPVAATNSSKILRLSLFAATRRLVHMVWRAAIARSRGEPSL